MCRNQTDVKKLFGENVKKYRIQNHLSQEKLGELCDLHRTYISEVERGLRNISLMNIYNLSVELNVNMSELLNFD